MGQSANCRRLLHDEKVLSLYESRAQSLSGDALENCAERQPGDVLGVGEIRGQAADTENRLESFAAESQHGRGTRRRFRPLRLSPRNRTGLCVPAYAVGYTRVTRHPSQVSLQT